MLRLSNFLNIEWLLGKHARSFWVVPGTRKYKYKDAPTGFVKDFPPRKLDARPWAGKMSMPSLTTSSILASKSDLPCPRLGRYLLLGFSFCLASILSARSSRSLTERRISHIISVCPDPIPAELPESGITHMRISIEDVDYADLLSHLPAACRFIDQAMRDGGTVLVHCVQGLSRSAAVIAAYCKCFGRP